MITLVQHTHQILDNSSPAYGVALRHARKLAEGKAFRAPHYTASERDLLGELAISAGGVLYLDEFQEFNRRSISSLFSIWRRMYPEHRPHIVIKALTGYLEHTEEWYPIGSPKLYENIPQIDEHIIVKETPERRNP